MGLTTILNLSPLESHKIFQRILCYYRQKQHTQPFFHYILLEDSYTTIYTDNCYNNDLKTHLRLFFHLELTSVQCSSIVHSLREDTRTHRILTQEHPMARNGLRQIYRTSDMAFIRTIQIWQPGRFQKDICRNYRGEAKKSWSPCIIGT